jgi:hypothetical protein
MARKPRKNDDPQLTIDPIDEMPISPHEIVHDEIFGDKA